MLVIRKEQREVFKDNQKQKFIKKTAVFLKKKYPEKTKVKTESTLSELINSTIDKALDYTIISENGVVAFLEFMFTLSLDFDSNPKTKWAQDILTDTNLNESNKIMLIINKIQINIENEISENSQREHDE